MDEFITNEEIYIPGYNLFRKDRNRFGGGVAIYTRDILNVVDGSQYVPDTIESVCVEITKSKTKPFLLTTVYRPLNSQWILWMR